MSLKYYLSFCLIFLFVSTCFCSVEEQINLSDIANYSLLPSKTFMIKNKLFLDFGAKNLYLTLRIPKQYKKNQIKILKLDAEKITKKENLIEEVNILSTQKYQQIMNELILESGIKSNKGILKYEYETDLGTTKDIETEISFNNSNDTDKSTNNNLKKELKAEKKADKENSKNAKENFINIIKNAYPDKTKFLALAKNVDDIVYTNDILLFRDEDRLKIYTEEYGIKTIIKYSELKYNDNIKFYILKK